MIPRSLLALAALTMLACSDPPPEPPPEPAKPAVEAPEAAGGPSIDERRAKYAARPTIALPEGLPPAWGIFVRALDGRLVEARHGVRSHRSRSGWRSVALTVRVFGEDDAIRARVHGALAGLELPKLPPLAATDDAFWRGAAIEDGPVRWSVDVGRLVAPPGEPREQIVTLEWQRTPPPPAEARDCRKPPPVEAPAIAPAWLIRTTNKRTTRRRITAETHRTAKADTVELRMYFRNGLAHDEHLRHLAEAAAKAGFERARGEGTRQAWGHPDGARFEFEPDTRGELHLGCDLAGPVLRLRWTKPAP